MPAAGVQVGFLILEVLERAPQQLNPRNHRRDQYQVEGESSRLLPSDHAMIGMYAGYSRLKLATKVYPVVFESDEAYTYYPF